MKKIILGLTLFTSISALANRGQDEFRAGLLLGQISIEKSECKYEECIEKLKNLKNAFEKVKNEAETEKIILNNMLGGNQVAELTTPMKKALNLIYPSWKMSYPELKLNKYKTLHLSCDSGITEIIQIQESEGNDDLYTYFEIISFSTVLSENLQRDYLDENTIAFYNIDDQKVAEFNIKDNNGYFIKDGRKEKLRRCEVINY